MSDDLIAPPDPFASHAEALGYTLGTGHLWVPFAVFQLWAERLLGRPIYTHEFADEATWAEMRHAFEFAARIRCTDPEPALSSQESPNT